MSKIDCRGGDTQGGKVLSEACGARRLRLRACRPWCSSATPWEGRGRRTPAPPAPASSACSSRCPYSCSRRAMTRRRRGAGVSRDQRGSTRRGPGAGFDPGAASAQLRELLRAAAAWRRRRRPRGAAEIGEERERRGAGRVEQTK
ncbi:hypothetical protein ACRAWF_06480 [Streptomyces sp. L7]